MLVGSNFGKQLPPQLGRYGQPVKIAPADFGCIAVI
jgi:hypothetical protein